MDELILRNETITSLEVAEMVGKDHKDLLRDIRRYCEQLGERKIAPSDFFKESTYTNNQNKEQPCYNVTKKGCEFIANKLTGVKGAAFTASYINRFHAMEDYLRTTNSNMVQDGMFAVKFIADDLRVNEASRLLMYETYCKDVGIPTNFLPKYEFNGNHELKAATTLLKANGCGISVLKFNELLSERGYLETRERPSSKGENKKYKALTDKGLQYGENAVNSHNQKEVQPLYYADKFMELYDIVTEG